MPGGGVVVEAEEAVAETARFLAAAPPPEPGANADVFARRSEALRAVLEKLRAIDAALASTLADLLRQRLAQPQLQTEVATLDELLADPDTYTRDRDAFDTAAARVEVARDELATAEERWLELEMLREEYAAIRGR